MNATITFTAKAITDAMEKQAAKNTGGFTVIGHADGTVKAYEHGQTISEPSIVLWNVSGDKKPLSRAAIKWLGIEDRVCILSESGFIEKDLW